MVIGSIISTLTGAIAPIINKVVPDKAQADKLTHELAMAIEKQAHEIALGQIELLKLDIQSGSFFQRGWRPMTAWSCLAIVLYDNIFADICNALFDLTLATTSIDTMPIILGMLGLGGMRSADKYMKTDSKQ